MARTKFARMALELLEDRLAPAGLLDVTFDADGKAIYDPTGGEYGTSVAVDSQGRIVVAGYTRNGLEPNALGFDFEVIRLTPDGKLDPSFGQGGVQTIDFSVGDVQSEDTASGVAIAAGDSVIVVGNALVSAVGSKVAVAKLTNTGVLDPTFDIDGKLMFTYVPGAIAFADAGVAIDPANQGIILGGLSGPAPYKFGVARLTPTGGFEPTFVGGGKTTFAITADSTNDVPFDLTLDSAGRTVVAGFSQIIGAQRFAVARLTPTGGFDGTFAGGGKTVFNSPGSTLNAAQTVDTDDANNIYLGGYTVAAANLTHMVGRLTSGGIPDPAFGTGGFFTGAVGSVQGVGVQLDGKVVAASTTFPPGGSSDFHVIRLDTTGKLDPKFNQTGPTPGTNVFDLGANQADVPGELVIDRDGRILVVGYNNTTEGIEVARLEGNRVGLQVTLSDGEALVRRGQTLTYALVVSNTGPDAADGAKLSTTGGDFFGATFTVTSTADAGVTGNTATGNALPNDTLTLPGGTKVTYTISVTLPESAIGSATLTSAVSVPTGVLDPDTGKNTATDTDTIRPVPAPLTVGGPVNGTATAFAPDTTTGQYATTAVASLSAFGGAGVTVRTASADVNGDTIADFVLVTGPGTPVRFAVVSGASGNQVLVGPTAPFTGSEDFTGGAFVSAADIDGDRRAELVFSPDQGGGGRVTIFSLLPGGLTTRRNFLTFEPSFRGGARTAIGDVNKDGTPDLAIAAGFLGGPRVTIFTGVGLIGGGGEPAPLANFFLFPGADAVDLRNGAFVALGDVNGDGFAEVIGGGGPGGAPRVFALSGQLIAAGNFEAVYASPVANYFVEGNLSDRGGVRVAAKDADGDNRSDIATGSGAGSPAVGRVYLGKDFSPGGAEPRSQSLDPFGGTSLADGVFVG